MSKPLDSSPFYLRHKPQHADSRLWSDSDCPSVPSSLHRTHACSNANKQGSTCAFQCAARTFISGDNRIVCQLAKDGGGVWSKEPPTCETGTCMACSAFVSVAKRSKSLLNKSSCPVNISFVNLLRKTNYSNFFLKENVRYPAISF